MKKHSQSVIPAEHRTAAVTAAAVSGLVRRRGLRVELLFSCDKAHVATGLGCSDVVYSQGR